MKVVGQNEFDKDFKHILIPSFISKYEFLAHGSFETTYFQQKLNSTYKTKCSHFEQEA